MTIGAVANERVDEAIAFGREADLDGSTEAGGSCGLAILAA